MLCKLKSHKLNSKFPFKTVYILGIRGLTTSYYIVYEYTISGHMELLSIYVLYIQNVYISIQYTYIPVQYIYLFLIQLKYTTHICSFCYSSF